MLEEGGGKFVAADGQVLMLNGKAVKIEDQIVDGFTYFILQDNLGTIMIEGVSYEYQVGMTWQDFIESVYNTNGYYFDSSSGALVNLAASYYVTVSGSEEKLYPQTMIVNGAEYVCEVHK